MGVGDWRSLLKWRGANRGSEGGSEYFVIDRVLPT